MSELDVIDRWLFARLTGDLALMALLGKDPDGLCVFDTKPSRGAVMPFVVYQLYSSGNDVTTANRTRIMAEPLYLVKAVCPGPSFGPVRPIANRIDDLLHKASGTNADGVVLGCARERPYKMLEEQGKQSFAWLGGFYRLWAQEAKP